MNQGLFTRSREFRLLSLLLLISIFVSIEACSDISSGFQNDQALQTIESVTNSNKIDLGIIDYEIVEIVSSGGFFHIANAINDHNLVTGITSNSAGDEFPFKWDEEQGFSLLPIPNDYTGRGLGINNNGVIVGEILSPVARAFLWSENTGFKILTPFERGEDFMFRAHDINSKNEVVGTSFFFGSPEYSASIWTEDFGLQPLGELNGYDSCEPIAINENTEVVGYCNKFLGGGFEERRAFYWSQTTGIIDIGTFSGNSSASDINDEGYVVGESHLENGSPRAFLWKYGESLQNLGTPGGTISGANSINNLGFVAGEGSETNNNNSGFIWEESLGFKSLPILYENFALGTPASINEHGYMAGTAINQDFTYSAVIYKPVKNTDTLPPELSFNVLKTSLWPPNHKMELVVSGISTTDNQDEDPTLEITISGNEPANGKGDGNTEQDWNVVQEPDGTYSVYVRAERSGRGMGRIYIVDITAVDESGNSTSEQVTVSVDHDKSI